MDFIWIIVGVSVVSAIAFAVQQQSVTQPGRDLANKFAALGTLSGRSKQEIIAVVGPPHSISAAAAGKTLLQWLPSGYHIALIFDGEVCEGVTHEYLHRD